MVKDEERLHELVLTPTYRLQTCHFRRRYEIYAARYLNKPPEVAANADKCLEVTAHFKELSELRKIMGHAETGSIK